MAMKLFMTCMIATGMSVCLTVGAMAQDPKEKPDDTWISVDGTVETVMRDSFILDYGAETITIEMDDGDRDADGYKLAKGDKVRVTGKIDDDLFETRTIEASSVYVENLGNYFYASAVDEEDTFVTYTTPVTVPGAVLQGTVTAVDDEEFMLNTGVRQVNVEVEEMTYDPLDDVGYQKIGIGDRVSVYGRFDTDFFEGEREFVASTIVKLSN